MIILASLLGVVEASTASTAFVTVTTTVGPSMSRMERHSRKIKTKIRGMRLGPVGEEFPTRINLNSNSDAVSLNRRLWIFLALTTSTTTTSRANAAAYATSPSPTLSNNNNNWPTLRAELSLVIDTLQTLLTNWSRAIIDCTYADVPRELLQQKNKALLLEKASTYALFDKSVSVTSCKTVNHRVRDYLGRTGLGPVAGLESLLQKIVALALMTTTEQLPTTTATTNNNLLVLYDDPMDAIVQTVEEIQRQLIRADSWSYSARRDFYSMNNFNPDESDRVLNNPTSDYALCKAAIQSAVDQLNLLLTMLPLE